MHMITTKKYCSLFLFLENLISLEHLFQQKNMMIKPSLGFHLPGSMCLTITDRPATQSLFQSLFFCRARVLVCLQLSAFIACNLL